MPFLSPNARSKRKNQGKNTLHPKSMIFCLPCPECKAAAVGLLLAAGIVLRPPGLISRVAKQQCPKEPNTRSVSAVADDQGLDLT